MNETDARRRFQELLPWHVNGTLESTERAWVDTYLREHPDAQSELRWTEGLQTKVREAASAAAEEVSPELGLDRLMIRISAEAAATPRKAAAQAPAGIAERIRDFFAALQLKPAMAVGAAVIVAQAAVIGTLMNTQMAAEDPEYSTIRSLAPGQIVSGPVLQVSFSADAAERDLRALLVQAGGTLVGGPGQLGNYLIAVPADKLDRASQLFAASHLVEHVAVLEQFPARE